MAKQKAGAVTHRRNHYIPKFMLNYWVVQENGRKGVNYYSVERRQADFEVLTSRTRDPFSFAIVDDLYVPIVGGERSLEIEVGWLNEVERVLGIIARMAHARSEVALHRQADLDSFVRGLLVLGHRSPAVLKRTEETIEAVPLIREHNPGWSGKPTRQLALENMVSVVNELAERSGFIEIDFYHSGDLSFILCDRPTFDYKPRRAWFTVLTNKIAVVCRPGSVETTYKHKDATPDLVDVINTEVSRRARAWIVADSRPLLDEHSKVIGTQTWDECWASSATAPLPATETGTLWKFQ